LEAAGNSRQHHQARFYAPKPRGEVGLMANPGRLTGQTEPNTLDRFIYTQLKLNYVSNFAEDIPK
jgi:hypothetical protein